MILRTLVAVALSVGALWGEPDRAVGRTGLVLLVWIALAGWPTPRRPPAPDARAALVRTATARGAAATGIALALPVVALAVRVDVALGASTSAALLVALVGLLLIGGLAAGAARAAGSNGWAWAWTGVVVALPLCAAAFSAGARPGAAVPGALALGARTSPLTWAWSAARVGPLAAADGLPSPWPALATVALLAALAMRGSGERAA